MPKEVIIPALGESITSGILSSWKVEEGSYVELDQPIYELETDKITQEGLADASGTIKFLAQEGDEVEIGATIATIDESADSPSGSANDSTKEEDTDATSTSEETVPEPKEEVAEALQEKSIKALHLHLHPNQNLLTRLPPTHLPCGSCWRKQALTPPPLKAPARMVV